MSRPTILLNPGPVTLSDRVRQALSREDQCHREPGYAKLMLDIIQRLANVYPQSANNYVPITVTGSGTCAVEAMVSSFAPKQHKTLVIANGVYGERMAAMLDAHGKPNILIKGDWLQAMDLKTASEYISNDADISHVIAVQNETTTGRLNDIAALGAICKKHNKALLLDAVSSFAAEEIDFENWNLQAVAATANKCLHAVPGMAFVLADKNRLEQGNSQSNTLYLDLFKYYEAQKAGFSPFTPAVHASYALHEALLELEELGGWQARNQSYRQRSNEVKKTLKTLGLGTFIAETDYSSMITSYPLPKDMSYETLHDKMLAKGFVIYAGQGNLQKTVFRIATMGDIQAQDMQALISALTEVIS